MHEIASIERQQVLSFEEIERVWFAHFSPRHKRSPSESVSPRSEEPPSTDFTPLELAIGLTELTKTSNLGDLLWVYFASRFNQR